MTNISSWQAGRTSVAPDQNIDGWDIVLPNQPFQLFGGANVNFPFSVENNTSDVIVGGSITFTDLGPLVPSFNPRTLPTVMQVGQSSSPLLEFNAPAGFGSQTITATMTGLINNDPSQPVTTTVTIDFQEAVVNFSGQG